MNNPVKLGIKAKIILIIIPLLISSFTINSFISITSSRQNLFYISKQLLTYKIEQLQNYVSSQWDNLQKSDFAKDPIYTEIIKKSIESYAKGMIRKDSELIFAIDRGNNLIFSTSELDYNPGKIKIVEQNTKFKYITLTNFKISDNTYIGLSSVVSNIEWKIYIVENKKAFMKNILKMTYLQIITYVISLILISVILILSVSIITGPINRVRKAIHNITVNKNFSHKVKIEYPDEIGALVFDFNDMTSSLDLAYRKLKKYALDEAVAKKEMFIREKETLIVLGKASDYKDPETGAHIARVSNYSLLISKALGQDDNIQDLLYYAAPLHDIGKMGIPDSIILKPGKLTDKEFELIKTHTTIGSAILENPSSKYLKAGAVIAKSHHEKFDGSGYPYGLKGEEIPILGRIVAVADVFDALTTERPYKKAWTIEKTQEYMMSKKGIHFDPELVNLFFKNLPEIIKIQNKQYSL